MKKIGILLLTLVLTAAMFTACGCTRTRQDKATTPTGMTETMPTILPTEATTVPITQPTLPTAVETTPTGNGVMEDTTIGTTDATDAAETVPETRARNMLPGTANSGR